MAAFQIHEDLENAHVKRDALGDKLGISRKRAGTARCALQVLDNVEKPQVKRVKLCCEQKEVLRMVDVKIIRPPGNIIAKNNGRQEAQAVAESKKNVKFVETCRKVEVFPNTLLHNEEYKRDVWMHLKSLETSYDWPKFNYMKKQMHVTHNMRKILVDWLVAVADEYRMHEQTLHLAVNYIDRFLSRMAVSRDKFQLLGSAAMFLAGKVEEIYPPDAKEWCYLTGNTYSIQQMLKMEQLLLKCLNFDVQPPTMLTFIQHLCVEHNLDKETTFLAMYLSELVLLVGSDYFQHLPSKLAAASVALARLTLRKRSPWPEEFACSSGYTLEQLSPVVKRQHVTFRNSPTKPQKASLTKYEGTKYCRVAKITPRVLNLNE